jgi:arsenite methyltransferase
MKKQKLDLKDLVKNKYGQIANQSKQHNETSCCGAGGCCGEIDYTVFSENYTNVSGYNPEADLGLGCGIPTEFSEIRTGDAVLDLGSGAGNDCFVARAIVGETGQVVGLDFTDEMLKKANENNKKLGYTNIEFVKGDIEQMSFSDNSFDVVISNCVINLVPDKAKAFSEIFRVLKKGGHFCISDVVLKGDLPDSIKNDAEMYAGCVAGALQMDNYIDIIRQIGFIDIVIHKQQMIEIPQHILSNYLSEDELISFRNGDIGIFSITISAKR